MNLHRIEGDIVTLLRTMRQGAEDHATQHAEQIDRLRAQVTALEEELLRVRSDCVGLRSRLAEAIRKASAP